MVTIYPLTGRRKLYIIGGTVVGVVVVLALALGLGLGLGLKKKNGTQAGSSNYVTTNSSFLLDPSFEITSTPTTRYYEWVVEEMPGSPDGFERMMLVVNGERDTQVNCRTPVLTRSCRSVPRTVGRGQQW